MFVEFVLKPTPAAVTHAVLVLTTRLAGGAPAPCPIQEFVPRLSCCMALLLWAQAACIKHVAAAWRRCCCTSLTCCSYWCLLASAAAPVHAVRWQHLTHQPLSRRSRSSNRQPSTHQPRIQLRWLHKACRPEYHRQHTANCKLHSTAQHQ